MAKGTPVYNRRALDTSICFWKVSAFHLSAQKSGSGFGETLFRFLKGTVVFVQQEHDAAHEITLGQNGRSSAKMVLFSPCQAA